jgi:hypothetical protein
LSIGSCSNLVDQSTRRNLGTVRAHGRSETVNADFGAALTRPAIGIRKVGSSAGSASYTLARRMNDAPNINTQTLIIGPCFNPAAPRRAP